ncbi:MAG TPA: glycoside hydrolase family 38 C-terminal domain-containing protein [Stellaceae bacterium]|nr:glycoside hydrolase family 38 C-terminal domain-containing protein [Stellaceae bacterium]
MPYSPVMPQARFAETERRIKAAVYTPVAPLAVLAWVTPEPVPYADRRTGREVRLRPGDRWSKAVFDCAWFHVTGIVPAAASGSDVVLLIDLNGEGCVVDGSGQPRLGLTNINSSFSRQHGEPGKRVVPIANPAAGDEIVDIWIEAGANDLFGERQDSGALKEAVIAVRHPNLYVLQYDFEVAHGLLQLLPATGADAACLHQALVAAADTLHDFTDAEAAKAREKLAPMLAARNGDPSLTISAVGHAHMDLAWLWPIRETVRKCGRTFATVLRMMDRYPEYVFGASQPQQYAWVKHHYPALYADIKRRVAEGRWEIQGAMWVEPDTNLPSGESLVRQILYGKRFFHDEFGQDPDCLWVPDVFGYTGSLPQILAKSGVPYFMTQKLSWSLVTRHPHHTFWWEGIDGSRVLAHLPPEATYNSAATPHSLLAAEQNFSEKGISDRCLLLFGIGDGGGGPGEEHLERLAREANLAGLPPVVQQPAKAFFAHIAATADRYPSWSGELYLERHQGTYTTQGRIKRHNRKLEIALRELELAAGFAAALAGSSYPHAELERIWKEALLYQFHDILPGSSITRVYDEAAPRYEALLAEVTALTGKADRALCSRIAAAPATHPTVVLNSLSWERAEWLRLAARWVKVHVPALGYAVIDAADREDFPPPIAERRRLENERLRLLFNTDGALRSCFDKENEREVLAPNAAGNILAVYRDAGDAWDFPMNYRDRAAKRFKLKAAEAFVDGPRAALRQHYRFGKSVLQQEIVLFAGSRRVDFITTVDWRESGQMLRTSFPVDIRASEATCDIQFGTIRRPTHCNTPADFAKFEVCAHKWVDLSDRGYGVALLNDCKYGHQLRGNVLDLNLLRSPSYPDPTADRGRHEFTYALYPHAGDHVAGGVTRAGYELNMPLRVLADPPGGGQLPSSAAWLRPEAANIIVETVKQAEDGRGLIVRLYEAAGASTSTVLHGGFALAGVDEVNLIEESPAPLNFTGRDVKLTFRPFEIRTLRLALTSRQ